MRDLIFTNFRQILESEFVRENLPHWIDLVFGFKQTGKEAVDAINVFHPATYYGFDVDSIPDSLEKAAWETMVKTYGQTPRQLFRTPHPMVVQNLLPESGDNLPVVKGGLDFLSLSVPKIKIRVIKLLISFFRHQRSEMG